MDLCTVDCHPSLSLEALFCGISAAVCQRRQLWRSSQTCFYCCCVFFGALFVFITVRVSFSLKYSRTCCTKTQTLQVIQAVLPIRGQWIHNVCLSRKVIKDQPPAHLDVLLSLILSADVLFSIHVSLPSQLFEWQVRLSTLWTLSSYWRSSLNWSSVILCFLAESVGKQEQGVAFSEWIKSFSEGKVLSQNSNALYNNNENCKSKRGKKLMKMFWTEVLLSFNLLEERNMTRKILFLPKGFSEKKTNTDKMVFSLHLNQIKKKEKPPDKHHQI